MRKDLVVACCLSILISTVAVSGAAVAQTDTDTHVGIALESDGDAVWTVTTRVPLEDEAGRQAFDGLEAEVAGANTTAMFEAFAERAENETGREMSVEMSSAETRRDGERGIVRVELIWEGFGTVDNRTGRVYVDDIFEGGLSLEEGQVVTLYAPDGYGVDTTNTTATADDRSVSWEGPVDLEEGVSVVFERNRTDDTGNEGEGLPGFGVSSSLLAVLLISYGRLR
jgi:hypothetical protein